MDNARPTSRLALGAWPIANGIVPRTALRFLIVIADTDFYTVTRVLKLVQPDLVPTRYHLQYQSISGSQLRQYSNVTNAYSHYTYALKSRYYVVQAIGERERKNNNSQLAITIQSTFLISMSIS